MADRSQMFPGNSDCELANSEEETVRERGLDIQACHVRTQQNVPRMYNPTDEESQLSLPRNDGDIVFDEESQLSLPGNDGDNVFDESQLSLPGNDGDNVSDEESQLSLPRNDGDNVFDEDLDVRAKKLLYLKWPVLKLEETQVKDAIAVADLLLHPDPDVICTSVPRGCEENYSFLIDTSKLRYIEDLTCDDNGKYGKYSYCKSVLLLGENGIHCPP
jgi:hypothetical protein